MNFLHILTTGYISVTVLGCRHEPELYTRSTFSQINTYKQAEPRWEANLVLPKLSWPPKSASYKVGFVKCSTTCISKMFKCFLIYFLLYRDTGVGEESIVHSWTEWKKRYPVPGRMDDTFRV